MKKISLIILLLAITAITTLTVYTLTHQNIEGTEGMVRVKSIEKATSNLTSNELNEIYNLQINGKRHKLKSNYYVTFEDGYANITLTLYLDGFEILNMVVEDKIKAKNIEDIFIEENSFPVIEESDIKIINTDQDYLLINIYSDVENIKEEYYVWNVDRETLLENIIVYDESISYTSTTEEPLNMFYDSERQVLAKVEDNEIYALEQEQVGEIMILQEYKYTFKNNEVNKELINTYENVTINDKK